MPRVLIVGDMIHDYTRVCRMKGNLCQEMPLPQLCESRNFITGGGAGLVARNLAAIMGGGSVVLRWRTESTKERICVEPYNYWICRIDTDWKNATPDLTFENNVIDDINRGPYAAVIVSDYGKHTLNFPFARRIIGATQALSIPVFVDARHHWDWYIGAFAAFPNRTEYRPAIHELYKHIIHKDGANGCYVDLQHISAEPHDYEMVDTCGAGDVFLAAFVAKYLSQLPLDAEHEHLRLRAAASFANQAAGASVKHFGTYIVREGEDV